MPLQEVAKKNAQRVPVFHLVSPSSNKCHNYSTQIQYNIMTLRLTFLQPTGFVQFSPVLHELISVFVYIYSSMKFYHTCTFV